MLYLLLTVLFLISPFLTVPVFSQEQEPNAPSEQLHLREYACVAIDPASFKKCIIEAQQTAVPLIKIGAPIICTNAGECTFELKNLRSILLISPGNASSKFIRRGDFSYTVLNVENSANIEFKDLSFEDEGANGCPPATTCPPFFSLKTSSNIKMDKVNFIKTHGTGLLITDPKDVSITSSVFKNGFRSALEVRTTAFTQGLRIVGNNFENNAGTALVFQALSAVSDSLVTANKFTNNHSGGAYSNCTYPCTGAQIKILGPTNNLRLSQNTVTGGVNSAFDALGLYASGVEVAGKDVGNTTLYCNEISGNRGSGIVQSGPFQNTGNIRISENKLYNNGLNLNIPTATTDENNCFTAECKLSCMGTQ